MGCGAVQNLQASEPINKNKDFINGLDKHQNEKGTNNLQNKQSIKKETMDHGYSIKELLGKGTYGEVYRCEKNLTGEEFALKIVKLNAKNKEEAKRHVNNLKSEISVLKKLNHQNIVKYHTFDISPDNETVEIVFELIEDGSLKDYLNKNGPLSEAEASRFCKQILEGLDYLHEKSIIHRDLKCANILIGKGDVIKITDFGTAKEVKVKTHEDIAKLCASLKGTPYYMAPEILKRSGHHKSADIWSFGCTLIEMLTGKPPWTTLTENFEEIISYIMSGIHPPLPPNISKECNFFLQSCFDIVPSQRLTARELLNHRFILSNSRLNSPRLAYEILSPKNEIKSIASIAAKKYSENVEIMDYNDTSTTKRKKSARSNYSEDAPEFKVKSGAFKRSSKNEIDKPIRSSHLDTSMNNKSSEPYLSYHVQTGEEIEVSEPYLAPKKGVIRNSIKTKNNDLKKVAKTAGHVKMTEENLLDWEQIEEEMISNQQNSFKDTSSRHDSIKGNTYGVGKKYSSRVNTENVLGGYDQIINTNLAKEERNWYIENQKRLMDKKEEEKRKWEQELKKESQAIATRREISERMLRNFH